MSGIPELKHSFRILSMCHQKENQTPKTGKVSDLIVKDLSYLVPWEKKLSEMSKRQRTLYNFIWTSEPSSSILQFQINTHGTVFSYKLLFHFVWTTWRADLHYSPTFQSKSTLVLSYSFCVPLLQCATYSWVFDCIIFHSIYTFLGQSQTTL